MTDLTAQERAALALWLIQQRPMTTRQLADRLELSMRGAWRMITNMSRVVPISYANRLWYVDAPALSSAQAPGCAEGCAEREEAPTDRDN